jgi:5-methylcytosine-specific restriction endonuclease McrA
MQKLELENFLAKVRQANPKEIVIKTKVPVRKRSAKKKTGKETKKKTKKKKKGAKRRVKTAKERLQERLEARRNKKQIPSREAKAAFFDSWEWQHIRLQIINKYGRVCLCCGAKPPECIIQVDHIMPISLYWHLRKDPDNLQVLCKQCNMGKSNTDMTDFRPDKKEAKIKRGLDYFGVSFNKNEKIEKLENLLAVYKKTLT